MLSQIVSKENWKGVPLIPAYYILTNDKTTRLMKIYQKHSECLQPTGEGVQDENAENQGSQDRVMDYYIPGSGPDESTPEAAVNIWCM